MPRELQPCGTLSAYARHLRLREPTCEACRKAKTAYMRSRYTPHPREGDPCGTLGGYQKHNGRGEKPCEPCRQANATYQREWRAKRAAERQREAFEAMLAEAWAETAPKTPPAAKATPSKKTTTAPRELAPCGTEAAYQRHKKRGEQACQPCLDALAAAVRRRWRDKHPEVKRRFVAECGTPSGYQAHRDRGETPCTECKQAASRATKEQRLRRLERARAAAAEEA